MRSYFRRKGKPAPAIRSGSLRADIILFGSPATIAATFCVAALGP
jgi:hypothetical protein